MRFIDLHVDGFGKMVNRDISFDPDLNVVYGQNEAGKSTLHACIRAMLFGIKRAKGVAAQTDTWSHYKPWKSKKYGGYLRMEHEGGTYRVVRDFLDNPLGVKVIDEADGKELPNGDRWLSQVLCNMTVSSYDNTISIGQLKSSTDKAMAEEIKNFIINANTTGNSALNCAKAKEFLNAQKADLAMQLVPEATRKYAFNSGELKKLEEEIKDEKYVDNIESLEEEIDKLNAKNEENSKEIHSLNETISKERQVLIDNSFNTSEDVEKSKEKFKSVCEEYYKAIKNSRVGTYRLIWIVFLIFALGCGAAAILVAVFKGNNIVTVMTGIKASDMLVVSAFAYIVFLILAVIFFIKCRIERHKLEAAAGMLSSALRFYGAKDDLSEASINQVNEYLNNIGKVAVSVEEKESTIGRIRDEQDQIVDRKTQARDSIEEKTNLQKELQDKLQRIKDLISENEGLKDIMKVNDRVTSEMDAVDLALETIDDIARDYKDSVGVYLNGEVSRYIREITNGAYNSVSISDDMGVYLNTEDKPVAIESVSSGTSDQIYLAMRLASARLMQNKEFKLPLIFDDSFVNYDASRLEAALKWVTGFYKNQIIIFSCHKREGQLLENNGISFKKIEL